MTHTSDFITTSRYVTNKNSPDKGDIISMPINQQLLKRRLRIMIGEAIDNMPK